MALKARSSKTVPHYRTWKSLAEVESSKFNPEERDRKDHFYPFEIIQTFLIEKTLYELCKIINFTHELNFFKLKIFLHLNIKLQKG